MITIIVHFLGSVFVKLEASLDDTPNTLVKKIAEKINYNGDFFEVSSIRFGSFDTRLIKAQENFRKISEPEYKGPDYKNMPLREFQMEELSKQYKQVYLWAGYNPYKHLSFEEIDAIDCCPMDRIFIRDEEGLMIRTVEASYSTISDLITRVDLTLDCFVKYNLDYSELLSLNNKSLKELGLKTTLSQNSIVKDTVLNLACSLRKICSEARHNDLLKSDIVVKPFHKLYITEKIEAYIMDAEALKL